ncbi:ABC transporter ATP-binding protein [Actinomadura sp. KC216]|uniref:ABC transporter ATP-binding protein n=1 Tax=Actinomadura sp. KC216 TaxID=2530370 RepID=UPI0010432D38|nr:ABC transporter ATP-binding protein [Actinomadura sp. KC216]TDB87905.1 ABC transporter ATP-binding protein [Actinomadura sp. KC216]
MKPITEHATGPLLRVENLRVAYETGRGLPGLLPGRRRRFDAVRDVSFDIAPGETFGLVGESGSGKTTTGRAVLRLVRPAAGRVVFDGQDVTAFGRRTPRWYRQAVQVVFQDPLASLNPRHLVSQALEQAISRRAEPVPRSRRRAEVLDLLDQVGLAAHHADRYPYELSGGQRQRVVIARALAVGPRLVICDEAVSALDVSTQGQIINLLAGLQRELGLALLFISHDLAVVRHISHRVGVMYLGRLVETGDANRVYREPAHPYTRVLLESAPPPDPATQRARRSRTPSGEPASPLSPPSGCAFHPRCPSAFEPCAGTGPPPRAMPDGVVRCHLDPVKPVN